MPNVAALSRHDPDHVPAHVGDPDVGTRWELTPYAACGDPSVVLTVTATELWLSPSEARELADALWELAARSAMSGAGP